MPSRSNFVRQWRYMELDGCNIWERLGTIRQRERKSFNL